MKLLNLFLMVILFSAFSFAQSNADGLCITITSPEGKETFQSGDKLIIEYETKEINKVTLGWSKNIGHLDHISSVEFDLSEKHHRY